MSYLPYIELLLFAAFMVGTPGPANLVIMAAGARYGMRRCVRFLLGLLAGKAVVHVCFGAGFGLVFDRYPTVVLALKFVSAALMIWMVLLTLRKPAAAGDPGQALGFGKGMVVHLANPKAYAMSLLAWSTFAPKIDGLENQFAAVLLSFALAQLIFHTGWGFAGQYLSRSLSGTRYLQEVLVGLTVIVVLLSLFA